MASRSWQSYTGSLSSIMTKLNEERDNITEFKILQNLGGLDFVLIYR